MLGFILAKAPMGAEGVLASFPRSLRAAIDPEARLRIESVSDFAAPLDARLVRQPDGLLDYQVSTAVGGGLSVIAFGELDQRGDTDLATVILDAYRAGGLDALGRIEGSHGAAIFDAGTGETLVFGDGIGQRAPRFAWVDGTLLVSSHDLLLTAAGVAPTPAVDAVIGLVQLGWSFGGASLFEGVDVVAPEEVVIIDAAGAVRRVAHPAHRMAAARRLEKPDVGALREEMVASLAGFLASRHRAGTKLRVELTAGFDSRGAISLANHVARADIEAFTDGPVNSQDTRVAARLCALLGLPHKSGGTPDNGREGRLRAVLDIACETNGNASALLAMTNSDRPLAERADSLSGDCGEVFRGYYYSKPGKARGAPFDPRRLAETVMQAYRVGEAYLSAKAQAALVDRIAARFARLAPFCQSHTDGLDLLYLLERTGVWNQKQRRLSSTARRAVPFTAHGANFAFLAVPGARGRETLLHELLMRRHAPETLWVPLNGETLPYLLVGGPVSRALARALTLVAKVGWKVRDKIGRSGRADTGRGDLEEVRTNNFLQHLDQDWPTLFGEGSVTRSILGAAVCDRLLNETRQRRKPDYEVAAYMVSVETLFAAARAAHAAHVADRHVADRGAPPALAVGGD